MDSKDPVRRLVGVIFLVIVIGLTLFSRIYSGFGSKTAPGTKPIIGTATIPPGATVIKMNTSSNHGQSDFEAIKLFMTFAQVKDVFRITSLSDPSMEQEAARGDVVVRFVNPDGSSIEVLLQSGKVMAAEQFNAETTAQRFPG